MDPASTQPLFKVTRQNSRTGYNIDGSQDVTWTVYFDTPHVPDNTIEVPAAEYNPDNVRKLLTEAATNIEAIHNLTPDDSAGSNAAS